MNEFLKRLNDLIAIVGGAITLQQAADWLAVKENAERLRAEGHEADAADKEKPNA